MDPIKVIVCLGTGYVLGFCTVLIIGLFASRKDQAVEDLREQATEDPKKVKIIFKQDNKEI